MKFLILSLLFLGAALIDAVAFETRITLSSRATIKEFPFQVSLQLPNRRGKYIHMCGASIIDKKWVLTAGHCVVALNDATLKSMIVVAGITKLSEVSEERQTLNVSQKFVHPKFKKPQVGPNDIAVLKLVQEFVYNNKVNAIDLPKAGSTPRGDAMLSGWGSVSFLINPLLPINPDGLRKTKYRLLNTYVCKVLLLPYGLVRNKANICTASIASSACNGDSGGPLSQNGTVIGIVSWGLTRCGFAPSVYTRVSSYIDFIRKSMSADVL